MRTCAYMAAQAVLRQLMILSSVTSTFSVPTTLPNSQIGWHTELQRTPLARPQRGIGNRTHYWLKMKLWSRRTTRGAYAALSTDRGHQVPLASFTSTPNWELTNYLSNITPQKSALNRGVWLKLESAVRKLAKKPTTDAVFVLTGPLYQQVMPVMPNADESHLIPSSYWKIVITEKNGIIKLASFIFNQESERRASFCEERFITSVRRIEIDTGLNFFHALEVAQQDELESGLNTLLADLGCTS